MLCGGAKHANKNKHRHFPEINQVHSLSIQTISMHLFEGCISWTCPQFDCREIVESLCCFNPLPFCLAWDSFVDGRNPKQPCWDVKKPVTLWDIYHINWWVYRISQPSTGCLGSTPHPRWQMKVEVRIPKPTKKLCVFWWESWNPGAIRGG